MPLMVRLMKAPATSTSEGNSFGGNTPLRAVISHSANTTMNGNAFRAIARQRALSGDAGAAKGWAVISAMRKHSAIYQRATTSLRPHPEERSKDRVSKDKGGPILRDASLRDAPQ